MFAVVNHLEFSKPVDAFKEVVQSSGLPTLSSYPGFMGFHFVKVDEFKAIVLLLWESGAAAKAGAQSFGPTWFATHFKPYLVGDENRSIGEVLVSS